jgi:starch phosphorylase
VVPFYYKVNDEGIPVEWVKMMKEAMKSLGAPFSARRMVKEYSQKFYQPALQSTAD